MSEFDFGSLIGKEDKKDTKDADKSKKKKTSGKTPVKKNKTVRKSTRRSYKTTSKKILKRLDIIENKLDKLTEVLDSTEIKELLLEKDALKEDLEKTEPEKNKALEEFYEHIPEKVLQTPDMEMIDTIYGRIGPIDWKYILEKAQDYGWLLNIYTLIRFFDKIDELLIDSRRKKLNLRSQWNNLDGRNKVLDEFGVRWTKNTLRRVGKTKRDIIDAFARFNNKPQTSMKLFEYLVQIDPEHYNQDREDEVDLKRVRNVLSVLNRTGFAQKINGEHGVRYFKLNPVLNE